MTSYTRACVGSFVALLHLAVALGACGGSTSEKGGSPSSSAPSDGSSSSSAPSDGSSSSSAPSDGAAAPSSASSEDAAACTSGSLTFALDLAPGTFSCLGGAEAGLPAGWGWSWLSVYGPGGDQLTLTAPCGVTCDSWSAQQCYDADCESAPSPPTSSNPTLSWDGTFYTTGLEAASCSAHAGPFTCYNASCVAPGKYTAKMCAQQVSSDQQACSLTGTIPTCTTVSFDWPPSAPGTVVTATLPTSSLLDGGSATADDGG